MSVPDFERAEYLEPRVIDGQVVGSGAIEPTSDRSDRFALALLFGAGAALAGAAGYALVGLSGFMISIVAIGMAWLIAKAMMAASGGVGGRRYQVAAVVLTYFSVSLGELLHVMWLLSRRGVPLGSIMSRFAPDLLLGPLFQVTQGVNGIIGLVIVAIGMRAAWRMAAGTVRTI